MKALFSFIAILFLGWVGVVYIVPQTQLAQTIQTEAEQRISEEFAVDAKVKGLRFGFFPPHIEMKRVSAKKDGELLWYVPRVFLWVDFSASWSLGRVKFNIELDNFEAFFGSGKNPQNAWREDIESAIEALRPFRPLFGFDSIRLKQGKVYYSEEVWKNINANLLQKEKGLLEGTINFTLQDKAYKNEVALLNDVAGRKLTLHLVRGKNKVSLQGVFRPQWRKGFQGIVTWNNGTHHFRGTLDSSLKKHRIKNATFNTHGFALSGEGEVFLTSTGAKLNFTVSSGKGSYRQVNFKQVKGAIETNFEQIQLRSLEAKFRHNKAVGSVKVKGLVNESGLASALFDLEATQTSSLLAHWFGADYIIPPHLGKSKLRMKIDPQDLRAKGWVDGSKIKFRYKNKVLNTRWDNKQGVRLAKQWGLPDIFGASKKPARIKVLLRRGDADDKLEFEAQFGNNRSTFFGVLQGAEKRNILKGLVQIKSAFAQGRGNINLSPYHLTGELDFARLRLSPRLEASLQDWLTQRTHKTKMSVKIKKGQWGKTPFQALDAKFSWAKDHLRIHRAKGKAFGGSFQLAADIFFKAKGAQNLVLNLQGLDGSAFSRFVFNRDFLEGKVDLEASFSSYGKNRKTLLAHLDGKGKIKVREGRFVGFDAGLVNVSLPELELFSLLGVVLEYAFSSGTTEFNSLASKFFVRQGKLVVRPLSFSNENLQAKLAFDADLPRQRLDAKFRFKLPLKPEYPALGFRLSGRFGDPRQEFSALGLERALAKDIINGGIERIKSGQEQTRLPLELRDLLHQAREEHKKKEIDLEREMDITSKLELAR